MSRDAPLNSFDLVRILVERAAAAMKVKQEILGLSVVSRDLTPSNNKIDSNSSFRGKLPRLLHNNSSKTGLNPPNNNKIVHLIKE